MSESQPPAETGEAPQAPQRRRTALIVGRGLHFLGLLSLPLTLGAVLGFYAADRGTRWLPDMLGVILAVLVFGLVALPFGRLLEGRAFKEAPGTKKLRRRVIVCLVLAAVGIAGRMVMFWVERPSPLTDLSIVQFNRAFEIDSRRYVEYDRGLERALVFLEKHEELFDEEKQSVPTPDQERELLDSWATVYDYAFSLDHIRIFYEDWYRFDPSRAGRSRHLRSFLLTFAAELALYEKSSRVVELLSRNENAVKFLDAPHPGRRLAADSFSRFRQELQGQRDLARVLAGEKYLLWLEKGLGGREAARGMGCAWLWKRAEGHLAAIDALSKRKLASATARSDLQELKRSLRRSWLPAQSSVAEWMGDVRVRRIGVYLITAEQLAEMAGRLRPGDVMLGRKNWYLSNMGLPGFWPHAVLYVGKPGEFDAYFDTPEVRAHLKKLSGEDLSLGEYIESRFPAAWREHRLVEDGKPRRVIEAISEGVVLNTLEHAGGDYLAALRPRLDRLAKAQAMIEAFSHVGKPYDFDFDFATDHALVCTELVWRSYRPAEGKPGLRFPLVEVVGRKTLPANEIARLFAAEHGKPNAQMDFVYFLDGLEQKGQAVVSTEEAFLKTPRLSKWGFRLK